MKTLKHKYDTLLQQQMLDTANRQDDTNSFLIKSETEMKDVRMKCSILENAKQQEINKNVELIQQMKELAINNEMMDNEYRGLLHKYDHAINEMRALESNLEHMTYRANKSESETVYLKKMREEEKQAQTIAIEGTIRVLHNIQWLLFSSFVFFLVA